MIGGGVAGTHAAQMAVGLGAHVTIVDLSIPQLRRLDERFDGRVDTRVSTRSTIAGGAAPYSYFAPSTTPVARIPELNGPPTTTDAPRLPASRISSA